MGRKAKKETNVHKRMHSLTHPTTEEEFHHFVDTIAIVPSNIYLPTFDISLTINKFAEDFSFEVYDVSKIFHAKNATSLKVCTSISLLVERSRRQKSTIHLAKMTEYNVESMVRADMYFQYTDMARGLTEAIVIGKHLLHAFCILNGETVKFYDVKDEKVVRSVIKQLEPEAECCICLETLAGLPTCIPFACGHAICTSCFTPSLKACPACRDHRSWKSLSLVSVF